MNYIIVTCLLALNIGLLSIAFKHIFEGWKYYKEISTNSDQKTKQKIRFIRLREINELAFLTKHLKISLCFTTIAMVVLSISSVSFLLNPKPSIERFSLLVVQTIIIKTLTWIIDSFCNYVKRERALLRKMLNELAVKIKDGDIPSSSYWKEH